MASRRSKRRSQKSWLLRAAVLLFIVGGAGAAYWYGSGRPLSPWLDAWLPALEATQVGDAGAGPPPRDVAATGSAPATPSLDVRPEARPELTPPPRSPELDVSLDASDERWRALARPFAQHPLARRALEGPDLIRTFVTATLEVAEGRSPVKRFPELAPEEPFEVAGDLLYLRVDPASYARYDALVDAFVALDSSGLLDAYARLEPLFDAAYAELGYPGEDFDALLTRAVDRLLQVPVLNRPPALVPRAKTYAYEDPQLEALESAQRQLLRTGPRNVRRVQDKLRELRSLLQERASAR